ncbi:hypothetical protein SDC9_121301 [bioreactor metagenome]|uniref:Uncharacterized protein n=1 Tax=bioreactor metagenome TaxID=1076179 RepID=A0A645CBK8_9ZZZZ
MIHFSAIDTLMIVKQPAANDIFLKLVYAFVHHRMTFRIFFIESFVYSVRYCENFYIPDFFIICIESDTHIIYGKVFNIVIHIVINFAGRIIEFRLADFSDYHVDETDQFFDLFMSEHNRVIHVFVGDFLCSGFDHNDLFFTCRDGQLKRGFFLLSRGRVYNEFSVDKPDHSPAYRSVPWNIGNRQCYGSADHAGYLR